MVLDSTDRSIIRALCEDARLSQRQLAQIVGVAQGTIANRIRKLEEEGAIQGYAPILGAEEVGWGMTVMSIQSPAITVMPHPTSSAPKIGA